LLIFQIALQGLVLRESYNSLSTKLFAQNLKTVISSDVKIYSFGYEFYGLSFYMDKTINRFNKIDMPNYGTVILFEDKVPEFRGVIGLNANMQLIAKSPNSLEDIGRKIVVYSFTIS
jgi:hypothetical protein